MVTHQIRVWGRVQGVGFRYFTQQLAKSLHVTGFAQNKLDGSVLVVGQGEPENVSRFIEKVKASPSPYGYVDRFEECLLEEQTIYKRFGSL